ncbi:unnamed protein product [Cylicocyclus nassatus]|uniref:non-specific serine/threonine protein kinase n=2 Tax=Strongylidae TaxID=27830 RepID=A0AA36HAZ3_CYLNA|nr:unnamed protein product [Cylicocyclus nassatus]
MTSSPRSRFYERVLKSGPFSCILSLTNCCLLSWGAAICSKFLSNIKKKRKVSMSNSRWYTDTSSVTSSSPAHSDASFDADVTLRGHSSINREHSFDDPSMPPLPPSSFSRPNRPPCLHKPKDLKTSVPPGDGICVPPVLLSPVLSRPVRSAQSATTSPLPAHNSPLTFQNSDSENSDGTPWRGSGGSINLARRSLAGGSRPATPNMSPVLNRSSSGSRLGALHLNSRSGSGSGLVLGRSIVRRTDSTSEADRRRKRLRRRTMAQGMCSESSVEGSWPSSSSSANLSRLRSGLGHSDPQISASSSHTPSPKLSKDVQTLSQTTRSSAARRSLNASTSPVLTQRCRSPSRGGGVGSSATLTTRTTAPVGVPLRSYSSRTGSSLMAPQHDNRRWSLASLPSTSGYGTPGSNSAFSSQYSSSEHLSEMLECMRVGAGRFDSNDSCPSAEDAMNTSFRPRSRSLTSPIKLNSDFSMEVVNRNSVYKERFPKAKAQMEEKLASFVAEHAPLSGGSSTGDADPGLDAAGNRRSMVLEIETCVDRTLLRLIGDGATRFLHHQIVEVASDCLARSRDETISCSYFCEMSQRLDETLNEAQQKTSQESFAYLSKLVKQLLMIVSRPARLLECLEFDPDEFYHLLEEAEGVVREQLGSGTARVPDLPQYIIGKLGLDRDPLMDVDPRAESPPNPAPSVASSRDDESTAGSSKGGEQPQKAPCEDDFETIRLVSNGAYGAVYLVRHRETRQRYALKKMNKQTLVLRNQVDQVFAERDILTMADNPFVVSFYGSFETRHHLCMLMEYVEGGDCAALLKSAGTLPIDLARLYVAETVLAIEYLHSYGIVHRDLKPDNLLITAMGHIKLTDFGLSKIGLMNRTTLVAEGFENAVDTHQFKDKQLCGTPEYIAPEVILRQGYGKPVDWWALGVILYEFLVGCVPFFGDTPEDLFSKVISEEVEYPDGEEALPSEAEDLIRRLLEKNPVERLGALVGATQLMVHPFFATLDFNTLLRQKAEFVPQLEHDEDTSYFDTRSDRYNHDAESCGEEETMAVAAATPMFHSFSTASPRHSLVNVEPQAALQSGTNQQTERSRKPSSTTQSSEDQADFMDEKECPIPSAMLLRRRFSAQRQANVSTSSSGTTGTGCLNTACSSTDSSMDASHVSTIVVGMDSRRSPLPRFAISCDPDEHHHTSTESRTSKELSPVDETVRFRAHPPSPLQLVIPSTSSSTTQAASSSSNDTCYVVSGGQLSPGAASASSVSSYDGASPHPIHGEQLSPAQSLSKPPITIRKGPFGFGFTLKSVRVYLGEHSDYYTIEHIVTAVVEGSPAYEAGLRSDDLITAVNGQAVYNLTHPQLMHRLLSYGNELTLKVTPLSATSIKEGAPRKTLGKLAKKKPKRPQRRVPLEKKPRKPSSLLRRLSGKRATNDIVPGSSSQKQTFMPRSVSSQDGAILGGPLTTTTCPPCASTSTSGTAVACPKSTCHKRLSDVGLREENRSPLVSSRPSSLRGLKQPLPPPLTPGSSASATLNVKMPTSPIPVSPLARTEHTESAPAGPIVTRSPSPSSSNKLMASGRSLLRMLHRDEKHDPSSGKH